MKPRINQAKLEELKESDPVAYADVLKDLAELDEIWEESPIQFARPHGKQRAFLEARPPDGVRTFVRLFLGGEQSGKTTAGALDDLVQACDLESIPESLRPYKRFDPPFKCRIFAPDFTHTLREGVMEKLREWVPKGQLLGGGWDKAFRPADRELLFANGSKFSFLSYEQDLDKMGSVTIDRVHFDEEPPGEKGRQFYLQARARVMAKGGDIIFTMTPELGMSWLHDELWERRDDPDVFAVTVATDENPFLPEGAVEETYGRMSAEEQAAKRKGVFVQFSGPVLKGFDDDRHVVDPPSVEHLKGQDVLVAIDPGITRAGVLWGAFDKDDVLLVFDELYPQDLNVADVAAQIKARNKEWGVEPVYYVIDPSGRNKSMMDGTVSEEFSSYGIHPVAGKNDRRASILQLRRRIASNPPALLVSRDCQKWLWEKNRWRVARDEKTEEGRARATAGDTFATTGPDHLQDCLRYLAMERVWGAPFAHTNASRPRWTPGVAPDFEWFESHTVEESAPMGLYS